MVTKPEPEWKNKYLKLEKKIKLTTYQMIEVGAFIETLISHSQVSLLERLVKKINRIDMYCTGPWIDNSEYKNGYKKALADVLISLDKLKRG